MTVPAFETTPIPGLLKVVPAASRDSRGTFAKTFVSSAFAEAGLATTFAEEYHTCSARRVVRGMHFQVPPHDHDKMVFCVAGSAFDVVLDIRVGSPTYGSAYTCRLEGPSGFGLYVPAGCAHGFAALEDDTVLSYKVTTAYVPDCDSGILWSSVPEVSWPHAYPQVSERDAAFPAYTEFLSPFAYAGGDR